MLLSSIAARRDCRRGSGVCSEKRVSSGYPVSAFTFPKKILKNF